jgi:hypothetical protein
MQLNANTLTLESLSYNNVLDSTDAYLVKDLSNIIKESETLANKYVVDMLVKPILSKKRLSKGSGKTVSKALCYSTSTFYQKHCSKV